MDPMQLYDGRRLQVRATRRHVHRATERTPEIARELGSMSLDVLLVREPGSETTTVISAGPLKGSVMRQIRAQVLLGDQGEFDIDGWHYEWKKVAADGGSDG